VIQDQILRYRAFPEEMVKNVPPEVRKAVEAGW
jgi:hypothetical protein